MTVLFPTAIPTHLQAYAGKGVWQDKTLADWAQLRAEESPDDEVYLGDPHQSTFSSLLSDGEALARALFDLGVKPGEVIAFQTPNWFEAAVINLAACLGGFVISPIVHIYRDAEVRHMLADCEARAFFVAETFRSFNYGEMVDRIAPSLPHLENILFVRPTTRAQGLQNLIAHGRNLKQSLPGSHVDAAKLILYTSGTTGLPKAVLHSHNTLSRVMEVTNQYLSLNGREITLMPSPVTHITGYCGALEKPFQLDARTVLMEQWDAAKAVELIERYQVNTTVAATPFLTELCNAAKAANASLSSLRSFNCGGASVPPELVKAANQALALPCATRVYGSSETPLATQGYKPDSDPELAAHTDGHAIDFELRIADDTGQCLPAGEEGEVLVRGPAMFLGYGDPAQTADALTSDGFFRTGDLGWISTAGALTISGRKKDLIIRGGENISAREIEEVLDAHPGVIESAVVSMPHPRLGEGICAFIKLQEASEVTVEELASHVYSSGLAKQKCPEKFIFVPTLPRTASGKVRKDMLREEAKGLQA